MGLMPAYSPEAGYGLKTLVITPGNPAVGRDAHQGGVLLFDVSTGEPLALLNASAVTEIRTAAVSAVATHLLARPGAAELAVIGTGVRGRAHAHATSYAASLLRSAITRPKFTTLTLYHSGIASGFDECGALPSLSGGAPHSYVCGGAVTGGRTLESFAIVG